MQFSFCLALHSINHYQFQQSFSTSPNEPQNLSRSPSVIIILLFLMDRRPFFSTQCFSTGRTTHQKCLFPRDPIIDGSLDPCKSTSQTAYLWLSYFCRAHGHSGGVAQWLTVTVVAWHSGRTSVSGRRTFPVLSSTCS